MRFVLASHESLSKKPPSGNLSVPGNCPPRCAQMPNFIAQRNGCYHNSFQTICHRWNFGREPWVIDPTEPFHPDPPQYRTLMKRLDETYNFPNIMHFEMCKIKLLEVKNYFQAPETVSDHAIMFTAKFCPEDPHRRTHDPPPIRRLYKDAYLQLKCLFGSEGRMKSCVFGVEILSFWSWIEQETVEN